MSITSLKKRMLIIVSNGAGNTTNQFSKLFQIINADQLVSKFFSLTWYTIEPDFPGFLNRSKIKAIIRRFQVE